MNRIITGECRTVMRDLIFDGVKVQCVVTSPPYWGLRAYATPPQVWGGDSSCKHEWGHERIFRVTGGTDESGLGRYANAVTEKSIKLKMARGKCFEASSGAHCQICGAWRGELGLEPNPFLYVQHMVEVFRLVRDLMADDGVCFVNIGDTYITRPCGGIGGNSAINGKGNHEALREASSVLTRMRRTGLKLKDMALVPERLAIALQDDGWWVRRRVIWWKTNTMPESVRDRFTVAHEHIWMLAKSERYFFNREGIREPASPNTHARMKRAHNGYAPPGQDKHGGILAPRPNSNGLGQKAVQRWPSGWDRGEGGHRDKIGRYPQPKANESFLKAVSPDVVKWRNMRDVWPIPTEPYKGKHYATFPQELARRCIRAGSRAGDVVFDPFVGSGTVPRVCVEQGRKYLGIDLDPKNEPLQEKRLAGVQVAIAL